MENPMIQFPYVNEAEDGRLIYSGVVPDGHGKFAVIAWVTPSAIPGKATYTHQGGLTYMNAVACAKGEVVAWYPELEVVS
jgi:hypothetical protein